MRVYETSSAKLSQSSERLRRDLIFGFRVWHLLFVFLFGSFIFFVVVCLGVSGFVFGSWVFSS